MTKRIQLAAALIAAPLLALTLHAAPLPLAEEGGVEIELDEAEVFIEFNSTDGDFGIQFFWDGEAWDKMRVLDDDERCVLRVRAARNVGRHGLTEGFFESNEPPVSQVSMEEFLARFPEGEYEFEGRTLEGDELEGETEFTHVIPAPPDNLFPADGDEIDPNLPLTASFDAVTEDVNGDPIEPVLYELVVESEDENEFLRIFSMTIRGDEANPSADIPAQFLEPGGEYKLEVIVQEESGNRTISEVEFETL